MGYTAMMFLPAVMMFPIIAAIASGVFWLLKKLGFTPAGVPGLITYALIGCAGYGVLFLFVTAQQFVYAPTRFQREYIGNVYGTPFSLRQYDQWGFQDPASEWRFALDAKDVATLRQRCRSHYNVDGTNRCVLYSGQDKRWFASVELRGSELYMIDGLH